MNYSPEVRSERNFFSNPLRLLHPLLRSVATLGMAASFLGGVGEVEARPISKNNPGECKSYPRSIDLTQDGEVNGKDKKMRDALKKTYQLFLDGKPVVALDFKGYLDTNGDGHINGKDDKVYDEILENPKKCVSLRANIR